MENEFLLQILKFQFIAQSHTLTEHVKRNLKNSSFCLPVCNFVNAVFDYRTLNGTMKSSTPDAKSTSSVPLRNRRVLYPTYPWMMVIPNRKLTAIVGLIFC